MTYRKKLIEVALPLEEINKQSAREKSIRHGHPSTLHLWWARRPLAACRAVLFASLVDDPGEYLPEEEARQERQRLFRLIEELVNWDNINNEKVLGQARLEIACSVARDLGEEPPVGEEAVREFLATKAPPVLDPFCGGGSIPLEAQRLGLRAYASDLNPVAVLITKALIEIPPKFAGRPPVHPQEDGNGQRELMKKKWRGAEGLAEDVRYYGRWMRDEAEKRIGHLYPPVKVTAELLAERPDLREQGLKPGEELTVIAWLWARTVTCPNPACGATMPLARSFWLSKKKGRKAWVEPVVEPGAKAVRFEVCVGQGAPPDGVVNRRGTRCIVCGTSVPFDHVRSEGRAGRMGAKLMAIVAEGNPGRVYLPPFPMHQEIAGRAEPHNVPDTDLPERALGFRVQLYGMTKHRDLFTSRQLVALTTFSDLVKEAREQVLQDALAAGLPDDGARLEEGGTGAQAYADAVAAYLALIASKLADRNSTIASWDVGSNSLRSTFARQAIPMVWDYCEANTLETMGGIGGAVEWVVRVIENLPASVIGRASLSDARHLSSNEQAIFSTDPPYYDNIGYADLADYFYIWLRQSLGDIFPSLFPTVLTPKTEELVATPYRFEGDRTRAKQFFEAGLREAFQRIRQAAHDRIPLTVYYAFKQAEEAVESSPVSTGWETMLEGLLRNDLAILATWPMRSELGNRPVASGTNALASSIVLACIPRPANTPIATRREFLATLKAELRKALKELQQGAIAPVDLAQAAIGPGMAVFSRYSKVLEADGSPMTVRMALALINQVLDEYLAEQEGELDPDTRWAVAWFEQYGHKEGPFGDAETLSKAKNTAVEGLERAGILESRAGKVRLLSRDELEEDWDPSSDKRLTVWEVVQHMILALEKDGEPGAARLLAQVGGLGEAARELAYRLYSICERKGWAKEALAYNMLATAWPRLAEMAGREAPPSQPELL